MGHEERKRARRIASFHDPLVRFARDCMGAAQDDVIELRRRLHESRATLGTTLGPKIHAARVAARDAELLYAAVCATAEERAAVFAAEVRRLERMTPPDIVGPDGTVWHYTGPRFGE